jgi:hypothetical protein
MKISPQITHRGLRPQPKKGATKIHKGTRRKKNSIHFIVPVMLFMRCFPGCDQNFLAKKQEVDGQYHKTFTDNILMVSGEASGIMRGCYEIAGLRKINSTVEK